MTMLHRSKQIVSRLVVPHGSLTNRGKALLAALAAIPSIMVMVAGRHGPGMTYDSIQYVSAARSFAESGVFLTFLGEPLTVWPPGLPFVLGTAIRAGLDVQLTTVLLNALCAGVTVLLTYRLAADVLDSRLGLLVAALVAFSVATVRVHVHLWSEPLFTLLTLAALVLLVRACMRERVTWGQTVTLGALVSGATMFRFIGLALIPVVLIGVLVAERKVARVPKALVAGALSAVGLVVLVVRNSWLGAEPMGYRTPSGRSVTELLLPTLTTLGSYLLPDSWVIATLAAGVLPAAAIVGAIALGVRRRDRGILVIGIVVGSYWVALWASEILGTVDLATQRMASPVLVPMLTLAVFGFRELTRATSGMTDPPWIALLGKVLAWVMVALMFASFSRGFQLTQQAWQQGLGRNSIEAMNSELGRALAELPEGSRFVATDPAQAYWVSGRRPAAEIPRATSSTSIDHLIEAAAQGDVEFLVFFSRDVGSASPELLQGAGLQLDLKGSFADGTLWSVDGAD